MKEIKLILSKEISEGYINWNKLESKIHGALNLVDNTFDCIRQDNAEVKKMSFHDSLNLTVNKSGDKFCYKLFKPRFLQGKLVCKGLQIGRYDLKGHPYFPMPGELF